MPQKCSVCTHEKRQEIDQALINGDSFRYVSQRFSVSTAALHRHRHGGHIAKTLVKAQNAREVAAADNLLDQVRQLQNIALGIVVKAANKGDLKTALMGIREARGCLDLLAKLQGDLPQEGEALRVVLDPPRTPAGFLEAADGRHQRRKLIATATCYSPAIERECSLTVPNSERKPPGGIP